jgi:hypothetical protein
MHASNGGIGSGLIGLLLLGGCAGEGSEQPVTPGNMPSDPGTEVRLELRTPGLDELVSELDQVEQEDAAALAARYPTAFSPQLGYDPLAAEGLEPILDNMLPQEDGALARARLRQNGFVILPGSRFPSFPYGYSTIYMNDLPVFVSTDMVLEALHRSYDAILTALEEEALVPQLAGLLRSMSTRLQEGNAGLAEDVAADLAFYLKVARELLNSGNQKRASDDGGPEVQHLVQLALDVAGEQELTLFGTRRLMDFSQFQPRGHYTESAALRGYFRAMIWLGRTDFRLIETLPSGARLFRRRQLEAAYGLRQLMDDAAFADWQAIDRTIEGMVGEHDEMTLTQLDALLSDLNLRKPEELASLDDATIAQAIIDGNYGAQRIASQVMRDITGATPLPLSSAFALFGQRYTVDSHVFSAVVFDRVRKRVMPDPLDAAFAALGNDQALTLLAPQLAADEYAGALGRVRTLVDAHPDTYWQSSMYTSWLGALRTLSPAPAGVAQADAGLPSVARTEAWGRRLLNTQLASWAELRRDNVLYVKQSYTSDAACEYPDAYVDPYPDFFYGMVGLAERATQILDELGLSPRFAESVQGYFSHFARINQRLGDMANRQRSGTPHTAEDLAFINEAIEVVTSCDGTLLGHNGWYRDLFYDPMQAVELDPTIADVHTDIGGDLPVPRDPSVLHVATGYPRLMLTTVNTCSGPRAYAGVVYAYHEVKTDGLVRITDEEWKASLDSEAREVPWLEPVLLQTRN